MPLPSPPDGGTRGLDLPAVGASLRRLAASPHAPWLQVEVARRMGERLQVIRRRPSVILDWWGGLGGSAAVLKRTYPDARRIVVAPSGSQPSSGVAHDGRRWWQPAQWRSRPSVVADEGAAMPAPAQLIWANLMLHAAADPPALFARWNSLLEVEGFAMFSCLGPGTLSELRALYARLGWPPPTIGFIDMHDLGDMLVEAGFADPVLDQETLTIRWSSAESLLADLRALGGNAAPARFAGCRTPRWRMRLLRELESLRGADGQIGVSFEVAYGHGFKAAPRLRPGETTVVSLDDMRAMVRAGRGGSVR